MLLFQSQPLALPTNVHHEGSLYAIAMLPFVDCCCLLLDDGYSGGGVIGYPVFFLLLVSWGWIFLSDAPMFPVVV